MQRHTWLAVSLALLFLVSGCGGGSDNDADTQSIPVDVGGNDDGTNPDDQSIPVVTTQNVPDDAQLYRDAQLQLFYPAGWTVSPDNSSQLFAPGVNAAGGSDNCVITSEPENGSLVELTDDVVSLLDDVPDPQVQFLVVNGQQATRITGQLTLLGLTIPTISQVMSDGSFAHLVFCVGDEDFTLLFDTMQIL